MISAARSEAVVSVENGSVTFNKGKYDLDAKISENADFIIASGAEVTLKDYDGQEEILDNATIVLDGQLNIDEKFTLTSDINLQTNDSSVIQVTAGRLELDGSSNLKGTLNLLHKGNLSLNNITLNGEFVFDAVAGNIDVLNNVVFNDANLEIGSDVSINIETGSQLQIDKGIVNIAGSNWDGTVLLNGGNLNISGFDADNKNGKTTSPAPPRPPDCTSGP